MKEEFMDYLASIGVPEALWQRVREMYHFYRDICAQEIGDIFVTDYINEEGSREFENLWFFSDKHHFMEAKGFVTRDDFDCVPMKNRIFYWEVKKQDYDFHRATDKSRLYLSFELHPPVTCEFKAAKGNCDYLRDIFLKYVVANLKE